MHIKDCIYYAGGDYEEQEDGSEWLVYFCSNEEMSCRDGECLAETHCSYLQGEEAKERIEKIEKEREEIRNRFSGITVNGFPIAEKIINQYKHLRRK